ncbi:MAG: hypothetical protein IPJ43_04440 [Saprospiraceae bacterium]|nr:hypothetical protein [Saprospiraceae bacterium]
MIRAFLNAYYDIRVDPKIEVRTAHTNEGDEAISEPFTISPIQQVILLKSICSILKRQKLGLRYYPWMVKASSIKILRPMNI